MAAALFGGYRWWQGQEAEAAAAAPSPNGFVQVEMPDGAPRNTVLVLAPPNCPSEQAQRAESLIAALDGQGIPVKRGSGIDFEVANPTPEQIAGIDRAVAVFRAGAPAVFVNGMAMSNPTASQAAAEYRRTRL
ncbi:hypothetical protein QFW77_01840 [Luteimonas sp. RD2P54]|uniref:Uncharacterized protein n=1 Tax=Luteimonas endophytica TaxID=3042023 RepID=A0ABT6J5B0_9GAMM|nr:hypothetical protein [Luteimonas endophytica]MDH5821737.1 hypothetical protein [Luteimonas endophytica]